MAWGPDAACRAATRRSMAARSAGDIMELYRRAPTSRVSRDDCPWGWGGRAVHTNSGQAQQAWQGVGWGGRGHGAGVQGWASLFDVVPFLCPLSPV